MRAYIKKSLFFPLFAIWLIAGTTGSIFFEKGAFLLWLNQLHTPLFDLFFYWATFIGDGAFFIAICFLLLFVRVRYAILGFLSYLLPGIITQVIKRAAEIPRPKGSFPEFDLLYQVEGVTIKSLYSFPSGHATTAFALFCFLSLLYKKNRYAGLLFGLLAIASGISRVYLLQHFLIDVIAGSLIGTISALFIFYWFQKQLPEGRYQWLDRPVTGLTKKRNG